MCLQGVMVRKRKKITQVIRPRPRPRNKLRHKGKVCCLSRPIVGSDESCDGAVKLVDS